MCTKDLSILKGKTIKEIYHGEYCGMYLEFTDGTKCFIAETLDEEIYIDEMEVING